jgi:methionine-rich copper-binding protein CopC
LINGRGAGVWWLSALLLVILAGGAEAHANLAASEPAKDARVLQPPSDLTLRFTQALKPEGSWVQLKGRDGLNVVREITFDGEAGKVMQAALPQIAPDQYTVTWQSLSADDDDYADGSFRFILLNPDGSSPAGLSQGVNEPDQPSGDGGTSMATLLAVAAGIGLVAAAGVFVVRYRKGSA